MTTKWEVGKTYKRRDGLDVFFVGYARDGSPVWESRSGTYTTNSDGVYHSHGQESTADVMPPLRENQLSLTLCGGTPLFAWGSAPDATIVTVRHDGVHIHEIMHGDQVIKVSVDE